MNTAANLPSAIALLNGLTLSRVSFGPLLVQLEFSGEYSGFIKITRPFEVRSADGAHVHVFDPQSNEPQPAAMMIVAVKDKTVESATLSEIRLEIGMGGRALVAVPFEDGDFEPVIFSGSHHMSPAKLAWHFVLPR